METKATLDKIPGYVQFETNTYCDQRCIFCTHDEIQNRKMSDEMIKRIIDEAIPAAHTCCPFWFQDPFLEPRLQTILRYIKQVNPWCKTVSYSTMTHATPDKMRKLVEDNTLDELYVYMYSQRTQLGMNIETATKNIEELFEIKDELLARTPRIIMMMIMDIHNNEEIDAWRKKWGWRTDTMVVPLDTLGGKKQFECRTKGPNTDKSKRKPCAMLWNSVNINADGDIMPCCVAFEKKDSFGNINDGKILDILNSEKAIKMREDHINGKIDNYDICKECSKWEWSQ